MKRPTPGQPPARPPRDILAVDLRGLKPAFTAWCTKEGIRPSDAVRAILARVLHGRPDVAAATTVPEAPERPSIRRKLALTPSESARIQRLASAEGFSPPKWIVGLIRARLTSSAQFGQAELEALMESNGRLLAIGRNLNQIAKAMHASPDGRVELTREQLEQLREEIKVHTRTVSVAMTANAQRWTVA